MQERETIRLSDDTACSKHNQRQAFTLVELLVVMFIISLLLSISVPALNRARQQARNLLGMRNQQQVVMAVNLFAEDHDDRYPASVATKGASDTYSWAEPMTLVSRLKGPRKYRSMSAYLRDYLEDARTLYCPKAPQPYKHLQALWKDGEDWDNPDTGPVGDQASGTYCFLWNYEGFLEGREELFRGPRNVGEGRRRGRSTLLVTDYLGFGGYRGSNVYRSCESFPRASITEETYFSSAFWSDWGDSASGAPSVKLSAGYTDGHVESYTPSEAAIMKVIRDRATNKLYSDETSPGNFYLPQNGLR